MGDSFLGAFTVLLLLGTAILGIRLFLAFTRLAKRLDEFLQSQKADLSQFEGEIARSQLDAVAKQGSALSAFQHDVLEHLQEIRRLQDGILSREQAFHLAELYLDLVAVRLEAELARAAEKQLKTMYRANQIEAIITELRRLYDATVIQSIRPLVSSFALRSNDRFDEFVAKVNNDAVTDAFIEIENHLITSVKTKSDYLIFVSHIRRVLRAANAQGRQRLRQRLEIVYGAPPSE